MQGFTDCFHGGCNCRRRKLQIEGMSAVIRAGLVLSALSLAWIDVFPPANPVVVPSRSIESVFDVPPPVRAILRRSCFDCHSYETRWPWYVRIPGIGALVRNDVANARAAMNFSDWNAAGTGNPNRSCGLLLAACADVQTGRMPKAQYRRMHPGAALSDEEVRTLCRWAALQASRGSSGTSRSRH